jgi:hypothetical protein
MLPDTSDMGSSHHFPDLVTPSSKSQSTLVATSDPETSSSAILDRLEEMKSLQGYELHEKLVQIASSESLRHQATSLRGNHAVLLVDLIHEVLYLSSCSVACIHNSNSA